MLDEMNRNDPDVRAAVVHALHRVAPEADLRSVPDDANLREAIDLDSMDVLNFFIALHDLLAVDIAESDYGRLTTIDNCVAYLNEKLAASA